MKIKPTSDISRRPGPILERAKYKANELRTLLLYYLPHSLTGLLPKSYVENFNLLSSAIYSMLKESISEEDISDAEAKLHRFADDFELLYGKENVTINLHLLRHIANAVRHNGPLWAQSMFGFESSNGTLAITNSTKNILHEVARKLNLECSLEAAKEMLQDLTVEGKQTIENFHNQLSIFEKFGLKVNSNRMAFYKSVMIRGKKYSSQKSKIIATTDCFVCAKDGSMGTIKYFFTTQNTVYALVSIFEAVGKCYHLPEVEDASVNKILHISEIVAKLMFMQIMNKNIVARIPNKYEKT